MMNSIGFAIVGCGRIAHRYVDLFYKQLISDAHIVCMCDLDLNRAQTLAQGLNVPAYSDLSEMMTQHSDRINAVLLLTDSGSHAPLTRVLCGYGKALVVEKPLALTLKEADEMICDCQQANVSLFVVQQNRYNKPVQYLKSVYDQNHFGQIVLATVRMRWCRTQDYYNQDSWRGTRRGEGGLLMNQGIHFLDMLTWFLGEPVSVVAKSRQALVKIETEDTVVAIVQFEGGTLGLIEVTTATRPVDIEGSFSLLGEKGIVEIGGLALNTFTQWQFSQSHPDLTICLDEYAESPKDVYGFGHERYLNHLVQHLQGQPLNISKGDDARGSLKLAAAIYRSVEEEKEIFLMSR